MEGKGTKSGTSRCSRSPTLSPSRTMPSRLLHRRHRLSRDPTKGRGRRTANTARNAIERPLQSPPPVTKRSPRYYPNTLMEPPPPAASPSSNIDGTDDAPSWSCSTNWAVCRGSLPDPICFETSASILEDDGGVDDGELGAVSISGGVLLARPAGEESAPCEITIHFKERHEIHRIYVRSTARVYEIFYASEPQERGNEYLCTVRCGPSGKEVFLPVCNSGAVINPKKDNNASAEVSGKTSKSESNTSSEDGWVEVKVPDSPPCHNGSNTFSKKQDKTIEADSQFCYEATAEISDASPCISVKLRLLSLQNKECVHVEEVYIYADPVESTDSGPPVSVEGNMTRNPLLAMLVPSILPLSKAGSSKIQDTTVSHDPFGQKHGSDASILVEKMTAIAREGMPKAHSSVVEKEQVVASDVDNEVIAPLDSDKEVAGLCHPPQSIDVNNEVFAPLDSDKEVPGLHHPPESIDVDNEVIAPLDSDKEVPGLHHQPESIPDEGKVTFGHLENTLGELVLRVGRIESFLSRFEENMLQPLNCIDTRLQRVEQQLDALSSRTVSSKHFQSSRISAPEFQFDEFDSDGGFNISDVAKEDATVNSPDVNKEDPTVNSPYMVKDNSTVLDGQNLFEDMLAGGPVLPAADGAAYVLVSDICPGLSIKAPEFLNEEEEHVSSNDISESAHIPCPKARTSLSVDDALTLALKAFMLSASPNSPKNGFASAQDLQSSNEAVDNPEMSANGMSFGVAKISGIIFDETNKAYSVNVDSSPDITSPEEGEGQEVCHQKWPQRSSGGLATEVSSNNQYGVGRDGASEVDENENDDRKRWSGDEDNGNGAANEIPNLTRSYKNWNEESSADSNVDDCVSESQRNMDWLDENSTDSENEPFALRNWLHGLKDDDRFREARFIGAKNHNDLSAEVSDKSGRCNQDKSKVEIQWALNFSQNGELEDMLDFKIEACRDDSVNDIGTWQQCNSCSSAIAQPGASVVPDNLLIDLGDVTVETKDFCTEGSNNQQLFSSLI